VTPLLDTPLLSADTSPTSPVTPLPGASLVTGVTGTTDAAGGVLADRTGAADSKCAWGKGATGALSTWLRHVQGFHVSNLLFRRNTGRGFGLVLISFFKMKSRPLPGKSAIYCLCNFRSHAMIRHAMRKVSTCSLYVNLWSMQYKNKSNAGKVCSNNLSMNSLCKSTNSAVLQNKLRSVSRDSRSDNFCPNKC
jgi:hypothetical protein